MKVAVLGAGKLGTALAQLISHNVEEVILIAHRMEVVDEINQKHSNSQYYPTITLSPNIKAISDQNMDISLDVLFLCVPSSVVRDITHNIKQYLKNDTIIVSTAKGIEYPSNKTMSNIIYEETGLNTVVLSGPNFASEIIQNLPTYTTISSKNSESMDVVENLLHTREFLVEKWDDVVGTELCGIIKNVNAIAYGICEGIGINENAKYAVLTKGFNEAKQIVKKMGGMTETVNKYCGFGDIVLTASSQESRNHTLGMLYGQGIVVDEKSSGILFEGKKSVTAIKEICNDLEIDSVVTNFVYDVLNHELPPGMAFEKLWKSMILL